MIHQNIFDDINLVANVYWILTTLLWNSDSVIMLLFTISILVQEMYESLSVPIKTSYKFWKII